MMVVEYDIVNLVIERKIGFVQRFRKRLQAMLSVIIISQKLTLTKKGCTMT